MPVVIVLALMPVQFGLWWHAKQAVDTAAEECVDAAQAEGANIVSDGRAGAYFILDRAGNVTNVAVSVTSTPDAVTCTVTGILNFSVVGTFEVRAAATGPIEQFIAGNTR